MFYEHCEEDYRDVEITWAVGFRAVVLDFSGCKHDLKAYGSTARERDDWRLRSTSLLLIMSLTVEVIVYDTLLHFLIMVSFWHSWKEFGRRQSTAHIDCT